MVVKEEQGVQEGAVDQVRLQAQTKTETGEMEEEVEVEALEVVEEVEAEAHLFSLWEVEPSDL